MSFKQVIPVPEGVQAEVSHNTVSVKGVKGEMQRTFTAKKVHVKKEDNAIHVLGSDSGKKTKAIVNSITAHVHNMLKGASEEFTYTLSIVYAHFPMTVAVKEGFIEVSNFLGSKKAKKARILGKTRVEVKGKEITVRGVNKEEVGQTAANIEKLTRVRDKDRRIFQDGIFITRKGE